MSASSAGRGERGAYFALGLPALVLLGAFFLVPLVQVLWLSVSEPRLGLQNYAELFTNPLIARIWLTTIRVCLVTTIVSVLLGYPSPSRSRRLGRGSRPPCSSASPRPFHSAS